MKKYIEPTDEQRRQLLTGYGVPFDRIVREKERRELTAVSRTTAWELEQERAYPPRKKIGKAGAGWLLSDLLHWMRNLE
ncbi:AlpA family phage regulatory protein [Salmonella enterica subsp. enterica]|nr:AlpA family phage regulatory protein [Salmonella enterica subsp. enterica serovar Tennessee]EDU0171260.1 AlpA family phage regulatory protein [Salmonella enterica subsp. enterica serovar Belfast]EFR2313548.1 AlpA family phage regulatory protein [Salmonella enterica]EGC2275113.1 AlpA family phage regulatory protein [Salmonella enterica subsp. enterica serovar Agbeni]EDX9681379.1 AlpA family phage regulatory protein [Salmonella enterica subsp. enterica serovar Belfast]